MPKVSIIVPNYNHANFLEQRIQSILKQTYQDYELILLDDASTDHSLDILSQYADHTKVSRVIENRVNTGVPFKQWNNGVSEAKGEYIWFAESDDFADETLLESLVALLDNNPQVGLAYCQSQGVDENNNALYDLKEWTDPIDKDHWNESYINNGKNECSHFLALRCTIPNASAVVFRRSVYESVGGADESFRLSGDWMLWSKLLLVSDVAFLAKSLNYFRMHANTVRQNSSRSAIALQEAFRIFDYIHKNITIEKSIQEKAFNLLMSRWVLEISQGRFDIKVNLGIYRNFSQLDPNIIRRIVDRFLKRLFK